MLSQSAQKIASGLGRRRDVYMTETNPSDHTGGAIVQCPVVGCGTRPPRAIAVRLISVLRSDGEHLASGAARAELPQPGGRASLSPRSAFTPQSRFARSPWRAAPHRGSRPACVDHFGDFERTGSARRPALRVVARCVWMRLPRGGATVALTAGPTDHGEECHRPLETLHELTASRPRTSTTPTDFQMGTSGRTSPWQ